MKKIMLTALLVAVFLFVTTGCGTESEKKAKQATATKVEEKKEDPKEKLKNDIIDKIGEIGARGGNKLSNFEVNNEQIIVTFQGEDNWTVDMTRGILFDEITDIAEIIKKSNLKYKEAVITATLSFTDAYGNTNEDMAAMVVLPKATIDKINFENFDSQNIRKVAARGFVHPSLQKE
jgi:hypothetical protein